MNGKGWQDAGLCHSFRRLVALGARQRLAMMPAATGMPAAARTTRTTAAGVGQALMPAAARTARTTAAGVGHALMPAAARTAGRVGEAELVAVRVAAARLTAARPTHTAPEAAMTDGAARMLPVAATPSSVAIGNVSVAAAIDEDAAARSPIHAIPAPEGRHDRPSWTPGPGGIDADWAESPK